MLNDRYLAYAGALLAASGVFELLSTIFPLEAFHASYEDSAVFWWSMSLPGIRLAVAGLFATLGIILFGGTRGVRRNEQAAEASGLAAGCTTPEQPL